jgi:hypothetical protein
LTSALASTSSCAVKIGIPTLAESLVASTTSSWFVQLLALRGTDPNLAAVLGDRVVFSDFPEASTDPHICHEELEMKKRENVIAK